MELENPAFQNVLANDLIMTRILRLLNLREQCEIQKINQRFDDLIRAHIWLEDYREVQMNCRQLAYLSDVEFFEFLKCNANNIQKLTIIEDDGSNVQRYFPAVYENLSQLRIKGILLNDLEFEHIANNCPKLQSFAYNANRESYDLQDKEFMQCLQLSQSYESFLLFKNLKTLILRDLLLKISYETLQIFAFGLQLERFEWHNLEVKPIERNFKKFRNLKFEKLKVLKIANVSSEKECWDFIEKCGNLRELNCQWPRNIALDVKFFDRFWQMEKLTLKGHTFMPSLEMIIVKLRNLKYLNIGEVDQEKEEVEEEEAKILENLPEAPEGVNRTYAHLRILRINLSHYPEDFRFLLSFLEKPKTILENLHSLSLSNSAINDEFIWLLSLKCQHLRELNLKYSQISGKYMNRMKKLQSLQLVKNKKAIPWSQLYCLLAELYQLEHLLLDELILSKDDWVITSNLPDFGNSWKFLKITQLNKQMDFWLYILQRSRGGFENLQTLDIGQYSTRGLVDFLICFRVPNLTLQACHKLYKDSPNLMILLSIYLKELTLIDCRGLTWPDIILILSSSKVEKFHMFNMPSIKIDYVTRRAADDNEMEKIVENLRSITLSYELFSQTAETWQELCLACPHFRLCCLGQYGQAVVLDMLLETDELKEKVKAIYANMELELLKKYCAENLNKTSSNVPVYLLDAENKKMWNPHFSNANGDLIIIIDM